MAAVVIPHPSPEVAHPRPRLTLVQGTGPSGLALLRRRLVAVAVALAVAVSLVVVVARVATLVGVGATAGPGAATELDPLQVAALSPAALPVAGDATYVVQPGDTLWGIAQSLAPDGDVRPVVDSLSEQVGGGVLQVGQRLDLRGV